MLTSNRFWWSNSSLQLVVWNGCVWMWKNNLMSHALYRLLKLRTSDGKDQCEATITKRLALLVEQLVVSSHEFSFIAFLLFFTFFKNYFQNLVPFSYPLFHHLYFRVLFYWFYNHFSIVFTSSFSSPSSPITSEFLFFPFSHSLTKNLLTIDMNINC